MQYSQAKLIMFIDHRRELASSSLFTLAPHSLRKTSKIIILRNKVKKWIIKKENNIGERFALRSYRLYKHVLVEIFAPFMPLFRVPLLNIHSFMTTPTENLSLKRVSFLH